MKNQDFLVEKQMATFGTSVQAHFEKFAADAGMAEEETNQLLEERLLTLRFCVVMKTPKLVEQMLERLNAAPNPELEVRCLVRRHKK